MGVISFSNAGHLGLGGGGSEMKDPTTTPDYFTLVFWKQSLIVQLGLQLTNDFETLVFISLPPKFSDYTNSLLPKS